MKGEVGENRKGQLKRERKLIDFYTVYSSEMLSMQVYLDSTIAWAPVCNNTGLITFLWVHVEM